MPSVLYKIPINGYTLYAEEEIKAIDDSYMKGNTMYIAPTLTTAHSPISGKRTAKEVGSYEYIVNPKNRIVNGKLTQMDGTPVRSFSLEDSEGRAFTSQKFYYLFATCNEKNTLRVMSKIANANDTRISRCEINISNPYIVTFDNPLINSDMTRNGEEGTAITKLKAKGYDL